MGVHADLYGFHGGFAHNYIGYLVPNQYGRVLAAVELTGFAAANVTTLALKDVSYSLQQFKGGIQHGIYGFLAPYQNDMAYSLTEVVRFELASLTTGSVSTMDLATVDATLGGFSGIFTDGTYGYLFGGSSYKLVRFLLSDFTTSTVSVLEHNSVNIIGGAALTSNGYLASDSEGPVQSFDLATFAFTTSVQVASQVSSWLSMVESSNRLFLLPLYNGSAIKQYCEASGAASCDGQVNQRSVSTSDFYFDYFQAVVSDGDGNAYTLPQSNGYVWRIDMSSMTPTNGYLSYATMGPYNAGWVFGDWVIATSYSSMDGYLVRFDKATLSSDISDAINLYNTDSRLAYLWGGFSDRNYTYAEPRRLLSPSNWGKHQVPGFYGVVARVDMTSVEVKVLDLTLINSARFRGASGGSEKRKGAYTEFRGGFQDGIWGYLVPNSNVVVRFNLDDFSTVETLDLSFDGILQSFIEGFDAFGTYGFLVPSSYKVARFSLSTFDQASVTSADLSTYDTTFVAGVMRVRTGYILGSSGVLVLLDLATMGTSSISLAATTGWYDVFLGPSGSVVGATNMDYKSYYEVCQETGCLSCPSSGTSAPAWWTSTPPWRPRAMRTSCLSWGRSRIISTPT
ncbi:unnamed protein product [Effrenium voratum]|nr:unnamed protein product [Effrenium voratum]